MRSEISNTPYRGVDGLASAECGSRDNGALSSRCGNNSANPCNYPYKYVQAVQGRVAGASMMVRNGPIRVRMRKLFHAPSVPKKRASDEARRRCESKVNIANPCLFFPAYTYITSPISFRTSCRPSYDVQERWPELSGGVGSGEGKLDLS